MSKLNRVENSRARKLEMWGTMPRRQRRVMQTAGLRDKIRKLVMLGIIKAAVKDAQSGAVTGRASTTGPNFYERAPRVTEPVGYFDDVAGSGSATHYALTAFEKRSEAAKRAAATRKRNYEREKQMHRDGYST